MGQAIGQILSFGVGVAISPVPIIAVVLILATPKGRTNGPAFLAGWIVGIAALGTIVLLVSNGASASNPRSAGDVGGHRENRPRCAVGVCSRSSNGEDARAATPTPSSRAG